MMNQLDNMVASATLSNTLVQDALIKLLVKKKIISEKDIRKAIKDRQYKVNAHAKQWQKKHKPKKAKLEPRPSYFG